MERKELALHRFRNGFNCAQSTFCVFAETMDMDLKQALRVATAFGGGGVGRGNTCGIISGGLMAIGLLYGKDDPEDDDAKAKTYELGRTFMERIESKHQHVMCNHLLGCDISTEDGKLYVKENGLREKVCEKVLEDAILALEKLLEM